MSSKRKYYVIFFGYHADVVAGKSGGEIYAMLDFASGIATIKAHGGYVAARDPGLFVNDLPGNVAELEGLLNELASSSRGNACRAVLSDMVAGRVPQPK
jgi:hypothetical protein